MRFSRQEVRELLVSASVITLIFIWPSFISMFPASIILFLLYFLFVGLGFMLHEIAHKLMAQSLGAWSEFRMWRDGLMFALVMRIIGGPVFIAPGAAYYSKPFVSREETGKISLAGPLTNLVLGLLFKLLVVLTGIQILSIGAIINFQLAFFNLLPIPPFDGSKILAWNKKIYAASFGASLILLFI
ncbi:MAG: site-2 protease family protein [Candidatus Altiarchaeota archaeon]|nr:site-2 protease family protein [Candidatus Altiarchaeota archaeon]